MAEIIILTGRANRRWEDMGRMSIISQIST